MYKPEWSCDVLLHYSNGGAEYAWYSKERDQFEAVGKDGLTRPIERTDIVWWEDAKET